MTVKIYISLTSGLKEVKKRQQKILMILDSKNIKYEIIDISEPGREEDKDFMQSNSTSKGGTASDPDPRHPLPPQVFYDQEYCGDFDQFELANEVDNLEDFLKLPPEERPHVNKGTLDTSKIDENHPNGKVIEDDANENKENKTDDQEVNEEETENKEQKTQEENVENIDNTEAKEEVIDEKTIVKELTTEKPVEDENPEQIIEKTETIDKAIEDKVFDNMETREKTDGEDEIFEKEIENEAPEKKPVSKTEIEETNNEENNSEESKPEGEEQQNKIEKFEESKVEDEEEIAREDLAKEENHDEAEEFGDEILPNNEKIKEESYVENKPTVKDVIQEEEEDEDEEEIEEVEEEDSGPQKELTESEKLILSEKQDQ